MGRVILEVTTHLELHTGGTVVPIGPHHPMLRMEEEHNPPEPRMEDTEPRDKEDSTGLGITRPLEDLTAGTEDSLRATGDITDTMLHKVIFPPE